MTAPAFPRVPATRDAIGGYFGLEPAAAGSGFDADGAIAFQSARAAFLALLHAERPAAVWLPWFICDSIAEPLAQAGVAQRRYALDDAFRPDPAVRLAPGEWLLYVDHFGLCADVKDELRQRFGADRLVFDHAQALFAERGPALATIASPRKFLAVPDGGLLWTAGAVPLPREADTGSPERAAAMQLRQSHGAEAGYAAFQRAEAGLSLQPPRAMSAFTRSLLAGADTAGIVAARRRHFEQLHAALAPTNRLRVPLLGTQVPLAYPYWPRDPLPRPALHQARVYVPTYWPELLDPARAVPPRERAWAAELLALPIDHRLDAETIDRHLIAPLCAPIPTEETA